MTTSEPKILFTDGEGPLVFKDLARDISSKIENGQLLFDTLSLYNAFISETRGPNEPGDTLALLVPHLLAHEISDEDLKEESQNVTLANGARDYLQSLREDNWHIRVISSAYSRLWEYVGPKLGISMDHIASTYLNLEWQRSNFWSRELTQIVLNAEREVTLNAHQIILAQEAYRKGATLRDIFCEINLMGRLGAAFDELYLKTLPNRGFEPFENTKVVGGNRKKEQAANFLSEIGAEPHQVVYTGDGITDDRVHKFIRENGGLSVAVNGDEFALRNAAVAVATVDMRNLKPLLDAWSRSGLEGVTSFIESTRASSIGKERSLLVNGEANYRHVHPEAIPSIVRLHLEYRDRTRDGATPLI